MFNRITSAAPLEDFRLLVHFVDGTAKEYDMSPLVKTDAYRDLEAVPGLFQQVVVDQGGYGLSWNDDIDIDCNELWAHGTAVDTPFDGLIALSDAVQLWSLSESALRKAISYRKLVDGVDVRKYGKQWVVTREAMLREYGTPTCATASP